MPNLKANAVRLRHAAQLRVSGVDAIYRRGNDVCELRLVPGQHRPQEYGADVEEVSADQFDFLALAEDLAINSTNTTPQRGDVIELGDETFEVTHGGEVDPWRYTDQTRQVMRVFTLRTTEA